VSIPDYEYTVEQCDVPEVRRGALAEYRAFRRKCLECLRGDSDTSVMNQVHDLTWHTVVFRTLNEARRLEPHRAVNGAMWELTTAGYANLMTLGIRRLVDKDEKTDSVPNVIARVERRPELLTREKYICYDGLPYDYEAVEKRHVESIDLSKGGHVGWLPTKGPDAWVTSQLLHKAFDALSGHPAKRKRTDTVQPKILADLKDSLRHPTIEKVCTMADKRVAHAERVAEGSGAVPQATYADIDNALRMIVRVANSLSSSFFYDATFGSVVATPQFDVLEALDQPWATPATIPALHRHWREISAAMDRWAYNTNEGFLPPTDTGE
jgi:hypothetical protein